MESPHKYRFPHQKNLMKTDVKEHKNGYVLEMDLPGFKKDEVKVALDIILYLLLFVPIFQILHIYPSMGI